MEFVVTYSYSNTVHVVAMYGHQVSLLMSPWYYTARKHSYRLDLAIESYIVLKSETLSIVSFCWLLD